MFSCPSCLLALSRADAAWSCARCSCAFPDLGGIPCLMPDPVQSRRTWDAEARAFADMMTASEALMVRELERPELPRSTQRRLEALVLGNRRHRDVVLELLSRGGITPAPSGQSEPLLPDLVRNYDFALRDWAWPAQSNSENQHALGVLMQAWPAGEPKRVLVLGAGAARLAWELHRVSRATRTVALDQSPLNLLLARAALGAGRLVLQEFPFAPAASDAPVVTHEIPAQHEPRAGFELVLGDARSPPFSAGSFDVVVTPWFIDVVDWELGRLVGRIHELLSPQGSWLNHGPLLYPSYRSVAERRPIAEVLELVSLGGFEIQQQDFHDVEHLRSPHDTRVRRERVHTFRADKAPFRASDDALSPPAWQVLPHRPVPRNALLRAAGGHPLLTAAARLVDGERTTDEIACALAQHPEFPRDAPAEAATRALLWYLAGGAAEPGDGETSS